MVSSAPGLQVDWSKPTAVETLKGLKFIRPPGGDGGWPSVVDKRFHELAPNGHLHRSDFGECVGIREREFAGKVFDALGRRRNISRDTISKEELHEFREHIFSNSSDDRLQIFDIVVKDTDGGRITKEIVKEMINLSAFMNKLSEMDEEQAEHYARVIMKELDPSNLGYILKEDLVLLLQVPRKNKKSANEMPRQRLRRGNTHWWWYRRAKYSLEENWKRVWVMLLWLCICAALFSWKFVQYRRRYVFQVAGYCICVAKGGAETLKFNMALILLPVCRKTITWIRNLTFVNRVVPFNDSLNFHKVIAVGITVGVGLHVISHLACGFPRLQLLPSGAAAADADADAEQLSTSHDHRRTWWFLKGIEDWTGLAMLVLMVISSTLATLWLGRGRPRLSGALMKRLSGSKAFWYSHYLFIIVYTLLVVHGHFLYLTNKWYHKSTWMYLAVPMILYVCERLALALRSRVLLVKILKVGAYPGNVMWLSFSKPKGFRNKSGQYILVNCAAVSPFQWHPFYITSAPQDNYASIHIKKLGDWTGDFQNVFSRMCCPPTKGKSLQLWEIDCRDNDDTNSKSLPQVLVDGPYGLTAQDFTEYDIVLFISFDIGATAMIPIIKDIINNMKQPDGDLESRAASNKSVSSSFRTLRAYFYWVTQDQSSFYWYRRVMDEVTEKDKKGVIELHNYFDGLCSDPRDTGSALITVLQSLNYAKHGVDIVSGTGVRTHLGQPNWYDVYKRMAFNHRDQRVGVFYSGFPTWVIKELRELAQDFSRKTTTKFEFHKETF